MNPADFYNPILITSFISWVLAQLAKTIIHALIHHKLDLHRLIGDGGMPSAHSAIVVSAAFAIGLRHGWNSPLFAVSAILALIVMHDATGVRQETGKQAKVLNNMIQLLQSMNTGALTQEEALKEFVGHTGRQVLAGALLGIAVAFAMWPLVP